jgi:hypothetical protein
VDLFSCYDGESWTSGRGQLTFGGAWRGERDPFALRLDGALQRGERDRRAVAAWMGGARAAARAQPLALPHAHCAVLGVLKGEAGRAPWCPWVIRSRSHRGLAEC